MIQVDVVEVRCGWNSNSGPALNPSTGGKKSNVVLFTGAQQHVPVTGRLHAKLALLNLLNCAPAGTLMDVTRKGCTDVESRGISQNSGTFRGPDGTQMCQDGHHAEKAS